MDDLAEKHAPETGFMDEMAVKHSIETGQSEFYTEDGVHFECAYCNPSDRFPYTGEN